MVTKEQTIIQDVLRAANRASSLLFDNLGIPINREEAFKIYCRAWNQSPKVVIIDRCILYPIETSKENYLNPATLSSEQQQAAIIQYAHDYAMRVWR